MPPTSRWIRMAITTHAKSRLSMRSATPSSESSRVTPRRVSITTRRNSLEIGSVPSRTIVSIDCAEREAGREAAGHQLQGVGEPVPKALSRLAALDLQVDATARSTRDDEDQDAEDEVAGAQQEADQAAADADAGTHEQPLGRSQVEPGGLQRCGDACLEVLVVGQGLLGRLPGLARRVAVGAVVAARARLARDGHHAVRLDLLGQGEVRCRLAAAEGQRHRRRRAGRGRWRRRRPARRSGRWRAVRS